MATGRDWADPEKKFFEDFALGDVVVTRGRTVDAADISLFAGLTGDHYPLHTDEEYARTTRFGTRIAHGPLTFALAVGLVAISGFYGDAIVALQEVRGLRALKPVVAGDTLVVHAAVTDVSDAKGPKYGTLGVTYSVRNQRREDVMVFDQIMLARRKSAAGV